MRILPAIDIKDGKCVRLAKGDYSKVTHYFDNPLSVAKNWIDQGATSIHIVDLDGAKDGETINYGIILIHFQFKLYCVRVQKEIL